jgi:CheY-like chemotaxis protein
MIPFCNDHRTVLLIDQNTRKQKLRATVLRGFEIEVHAAESMERAESLWKSGTYDLILVAAEEKVDESYFLSARIRLEKPEQRIALLVGPPAYIRELPGAAKPARQRREARTAKPILMLQPKPTVEPDTAVHWQQTIQKVVSDWYADKLAV